MLIAIFKYALLLKITFYDLVFYREPMIIFMLPGVLEYHYHVNPNQIERRYAHAIYIRPSNGGWVMGYCWVVVSHQEIEIVDLGENNANVKNNANVMNMYNESVRFEDFRCIHTSEGAIISKLRYFFENVNRDSSCIVTNI